MCNGEGGSAGGGNKIKIVPERENKIPQNPGKEAYNGI